MNPYWKAVPRYEFTVWKDVDGSRERKPLGFGLEGYSVAANETGFWIGEHRIMLDCGLISKLTPELIFITHGHMDHSGQIHKSIIDSGGVKPKIFCPAAMTSKFVDAINGMYAMSTNNPRPRIHNKYDIIGVNWNETLKYTIGGHPWIIEIIPCWHSVPTNGFGFTEERNKLKEEYIGMPGREIGQLRKSGVDVMEKKLVPMFCFLGDTSRKVLTIDTLDKYPTVIIECTFLDPDHKKEADKTRHMHWEYLKDHIRARPDQEFVLIHFSARYSPDWIRAFFSKYQKATTTVKRTVTRPIVKSIPVIDDTVIVTPIEGVHIDDAAALSRRAGATPAVIPTPKMETVQIEEEIMHPNYIPNIHIWVPMRHVDDAMTPDDV